MSFLNAEWRKLVLANYAVDPEVLLPYLPYKTELDTWNGTCYVSLVGFMFVNTRLLGIKVPFHINFEEVNLRFYVRYQEGNEWKRGVVFIKELVPRMALTMVANTLYNEHYQTVPMSHCWNEGDTNLEIEYQWMMKGKSQYIKVIANNKQIEIPLASETEFITEHYWGYTKINDSKTSAYQVTHPRWKAYPILSHEINVDFGLVYGKNFEFLNQSKPVSVMLAEGSEITVEGKRVIKQVHKIA